MISNLETMKNSNFLKAALFQDVDYTPIWIMRQAGRYLPEYRKVRKDLRDFLDLCKNPELATEVTMQPLRRFDLDAAILFSDILTIPDAMGLGLYFAEGEGPRFTNPITEDKHIINLKQPDVYTDLKYVLDTVKSIKSELNNKIPLIGFSGSPFTLATYMIEGGSSKNFSKIKSWLYQNPKTSHELMGKLSKAVSDYLIAQIEAGVDAVQIFDTWGGILSTEYYVEFSLNYMEKIIKNIKAKYPNIPVILFTKNSGLWLDKIANLNSQPNVIGLDWTCDIDLARNIINQNSNDAKISIQGNLDPCVLYADKETVKREAIKVLDKYKDANHSINGHIFNLGHGIHPTIDPDNVKILVDTVHEYSSKIR